MLDEALCRDVEYPQAYYNTTATSRNSNLLNPPVPSRPHGT